MSNKYCNGLDCAICGEKSDPCIYKIANELDEELTALQLNNDACAKEYNRVVEQNKQLQSRIQEQEEIISQLNKQILQALAVIQLYKDLKT
jgi:septal ring factor EnvC (AmiA/AmiB activator)